MLNTIIMTANLTPIGLNIVGLLNLFFLIVLISKNVLFDHRKSNLFIASTVVNIIMILLEVADYMLSPDCGLVTVVSEAIIISRKVICSCEIVMFPLIPVILLSLIGQYKHNYFGLIFIVQVGLVIGNIFSPFIFDISTENVYTRGILFFLPIVFSLIYLIILLFTTIKYYDTMRKSETMILFMLIVALIGCVVLKLFFHTLFIVWSCTSMCLVIYYLLLHIQLFQLDSLTGLYNRQTWDKDMETLNGHADCTLIMMDLNNLKKINDIRGHAEGDNAISRVARMIKLSFSPIGNCYRIGGDEFAIICRCSSEKVVQGFKKFDAYVDQQEYTVAYGSIEYHHETGEEIKAVFKSADKQMYQNKSDFKKSQQGLIR